VTYFGILDQAGLNSKVNGVIGLSQKKPFIGDSWSQDNRVGPLFIDAIVNDGVIKAPIFSLCMRGYGGK